MSEANLKSRISGYWNKVTLAKSAPRTRWWESSRIIEHVNRLVSGKPGLYRLSEGLTDVVTREGKGRVYEKGVSVGCGVGRKEMELVRAGLVRHFELYELSTERIRLGRELARSLRLEANVVFKEGDAFEEAAPGSFDFVHWNNSLHHMLDVELAVSWSSRVLRPGGLFYMDDFVGPARFQWSDASLRLANRIRGSLPQEYLRNPVRGRGPLSCEITRPSLDFMLANDPSEAAQSNLILGSVRRHFPDAKITLTGGLVYHLVLSDVLQNLHEQEPKAAAMLDLLLLIDQMSIRDPELDNHYATAYAWKG